MGRSQESIEKRKIADRSRAAKRYAEKRDQINARKRAAYADNIEQARERSRNYYNANADSCNQRRVNNARKEGDSRNEKQRAWYAARGEEGRRAIYEGRWKREPWRGLTKLLRDVAGGRISLTELNAVYESRIAWLDDQANSQKRR